MSLVNIKMFPASYGDSFLVTCYGKEKTHILIDMGFKSTYDNCIKKEIQKINECGETISLLVFTHIDEDHILGGIKFLEENKDEKIVKIQEIWHNSLKHIKKDYGISKIQDTKQKSLPAEKEISKIIMKGHEKERGVREISEISYLQGSTLSGLLYQNGYSKKWNSSYNHQAIVVEQSPKGLKSIFINDKVKITLLSPDNKDLNNLYQVWNEEICKWNGMNEISENLEDEAFEIYISRQIELRKKKRTVSGVSGKLNNIEEVANQNFDADTSPKNGSSIAFILEYESKKILFLSDSHSATIEKNLKKIQRYPHEKLYFDAIKISHHGSKHNTSKSLLNLIESKKYLISTNGMKKNHPDFETFCRIISNDKNKKKKIFFNYKPKIYSEINLDALKKEFNYEILYTNDPKEGTSYEITNIEI
ncbi:MBL fold metallo-hydrolase [Exiguobacterium sp. BG5(2022)]|uniref:MBL fold metallo-hydrolase n=1 Tax=Exiguobacterium sp. BG5(2022) TaxID=2962595 RepID=UPI00288196A5|nr:MBL fold metallo-hydrolase [Exiguobacterium sp. BG5(2022)]MDT0192148.1 MBL fold metallo-hydrolase [Exiguobacterium sp. BG5(2022)]